MYALKCGNKSVDCGSARALHRFACVHEGFGVEEIRVHQTREQHAHPQGESLGFAKKRTGWFSLYENLRRNGLTERTFQVALIIQPRF